MPTSTQNNKQKRLTCSCVWDKGRPNNATKDDHGFPNGGKVHLQAGMVTAWLWNKVRVFHSNGANNAVIKDVIRPCHAQLRPCTHALNPKITELHVTQQPIIARITPSFLPPLLLPLLLLLLPFLGAACLTLGRWVGVNATARRLRERREHVVRRRALDSRAVLTRGPIGQWNKRVLHALVEMILQSSIPIAGLVWAQRRRVRLH